MPRSCSSNSLNGCATCAPGLVLFSVSASANVPTPPACPEYLNESYSASKSYSGSTTYECITPCKFVGASGGGTQSSTVTTVTESEDGTTTIKTIYSFSSSGNTAVVDTCNPAGGAQGSCTNSTSTTTITKIDACGNLTSSSSSTGGPCEGANSIVDFAGGCYDTAGSTCDTITTCDEVTVKSAKGPIFNLCGTTYGMGVFQSKLTKSNEKKYDSAESIVSKQISKLKTNAFPAACKCGEGKKDDCWGPFGTFTFADPTVTISKAALKIGVIKEGFNKKYKSVGGTVKFYIPSEQDQEEERTPCCNDDFSGTVVTSMGFSLGGSDFKEGQYLATDIGQLSTGPVGQTVVACIEITSVSFI